MEKHILAKEDLYINAELNVPDFHINSCIGKYDYNKTNYYPNINYIKTLENLKNIEEHCFGTALYKNYSTWYFSHGENLYKLELDGSGDTEIVTYKKSIFYDDDDFVKTIESLFIYMDVVEVKDIVTMKVLYWDRTNQRVSTQFKNIDSPPLEDIIVNYNKNVREQIDFISDIKNIEKEGKLIILNGIPGAGKTYLIRALMNHWQHKYGIKSFSYISDPESFLSMPNYLMKLLHENSSSGKHIYLMEDCDFFIASTSKAEYNQAASRLLNSLDGILGQSSDCLFVLTANEDSNNIHEAFARKGRCAANLHFEGLSEEEAKEWCEHYGVDFNSLETENKSAGFRKSQSYALADLYASLRNKDQQNINDDDIDTPDDDIETPDDDIDGVDWLNSVMRKNRTTR